MSFWDVIWFIFVSFAFIAYLLVLFKIIVDLFRDRHTSGWVKAIWIVCLVIIPLLTSLVYLVARGRGMAERQMSAVSSAREAQGTYIKQVAGSSPTEEIRKAKDLLDSGAITQQEFDALKVKALS